MATKKKPLPRQHLENEKFIYELVSKMGVSKSICIKKLGLPANYFGRYLGCSENFDKALADFTTDILMSSVVDGINFSAAERKYMMMKLRVFDKEIELPVKNMKTAAHATTNLSFALDAYARKEIGEDVLQAIRQACDVFSSLMTSTVLEERIGDLEKLIESKL